MGGITARIAATILAILTMAGLLQTVLTVSKFDGAFTALLQSRLSVAVLDIRDTVETSLGLGLPLQSLVNTQDVLDKERAQDSHIQSVVVHDRAGQRLFDTDRTRIGKSVPPAWTQRLGGGQLWVLRDGEGFVVGTPLINSLGASVGGIVLRYDHEAYDTAFGAVLRRLAGSAAVVTIVALGIVSILVVWLFRPLRRRLEDLDAALQEEQVGKTTAGHHDDALLAGHLAPLHKALADVQSRLDKTAEMFARARDEQPGGKP